jgi:hypothetical protein
MGMTAADTKRPAPVRRQIFTPSSMPVIHSPGPLLLFIQQAQLAMVYAPGVR